MKKEWQRKAANKVRTCAQRTVLCIYTDMVRGGLRNANLKISYFMVLLVSVWPATQSKMDYGYQLKPSRFCKCTGTLNLAEVAIKLLNIWEGGSEQQHRGPWLFLCTVAPSRHDGPSEWYHRNIPFCILPNFISGYYISESCCNWLMV
jgi:hypothetical protein